MEPTHLLGRGQVANVRPEGSLGRDVGARSHRAVYLSPRLGRVNESGAPQNAGLDGPSFIHDGKSPPGAERGGGVFVRPAGAGEGAGAGARATAGAGRGATAAAGSCACVAARTGIRSTSGRAGRDDPRPTTYAETTATIATAIPA